MGRRTRALHTPGIIKSLPHASLRAPRPLYLESVRPSASLSVCLSVRPQHPSRWRRAAAGGGVHACTGNVT